MLNFCTERGDKVEFVRELGRGGEGVVYQIREYIEEEGDIVAKVYHRQHWPNAAKEAKLRFMAHAGDDDLHKHAAWPLTTLYQQNGGPVVGFLMPNAGGRLPVHEIYTPRDRKRIYPYKAWDFLVHVARNMAAALDTIHRHGHVVGDVNQNNIRVAADGTVMLVDTDSFQVNVNGMLCLCGVGSPHFTPPELQAGVSFDQTPRTPNHDNFGLAVLLFHLLFCGRHPYMGIPHGRLQSADDPLEKNIQLFRYAHAPDAMQRRCQPPLGAIPMDLVSETLQAMFFTAFTEDGTCGRERPTALEWMKQLDLLATQLQQCPKNRAHVYDKALTKCPWCEMWNAYKIAYFGSFSAQATPR